VLLREAILTRRCAGAQDRAQVSAREGRFRLDVSDCGDELQSLSDAWIEVSVTGSDGVARKLGARTKIGSVPYALQAQHAVNADNAEGALATQLQALSNRVTQLENAGGATNSAFYAIKRKDQMLSIGNEDVVLFDDEQYDLGNEYDPTTSTFTTRGGGYYEFSCNVAWNIDALGNVSNWEVNLIVNDIERTYTGAYGEGRYTSRQVQLATKLKPGDRVQCKELQETGTPQPINVKSTYVMFEGRRFAQ
jgi:hypothetical protein